MPLLLAMLALVLSTPADAVMLCAKPRGDGTYSTTVKIREACTPRETALDPSALGLQGPPGPQGPSGSVGPAGAPGPRGPGLVLVDADDVVVGPVVDKASQFVFTVAMTLAGRVFEIRFNESGIADQTGFTFYFETSNCTGAPLKDDQFTGVLPAPYQRGGVIYYPVTPLVTRSVLSELSYGQTPASCSGGVFTPPDVCCTVNAQVALFHELGSTTLSGLGFVAPYRIAIN